MFCFLRQSPSRAQKVNDYDVELRFVYNTDARLCQALRETKNVAFRDGQELRIK